jgi:hypothetical protein
VSPVERVEQALRAANCREQRPGRWTCPSHDDQRASLALTETQDGKALVKCHANCETAAVLEALGLQARDLFPDRPDAFDIVATYDYVNEQSELLFQVVRKSPKGFSQRRPDGSGGWVWKLGNVRRVLYRLPKVLEAIGFGDVVWVAEGEKDVHALESIGLTATCNSGGAGKWRRDYTRSLEGASVVIVADKDEAGYKHAKHVADELTAAGNSVRVVQAAHGKDAADHVAGGGSGDTFVPVNFDAVLGTAAQPARPPVTVDRSEGAAILSEVEQAYRRFIWFQGEEQSCAVALWTAHTHAIDVATTTPYLAPESAEVESGKTRTLEVAEHLAARAWRLTEPSEAAMFRKIQQDRPTVLLDEVDALWAKGDDRKGLRAILDVGYRRGGSVPRVVGEGTNMTVQDFEVFGAKALAGLAGKLPRTIVSRSIPIRLKRRGAGEHVERFRFGQAQAELQPIHDRLAAWVETVREELAEAEAEIPEALSDRQADCWEPLLAIADAAGGDWPRRAREAAVVLHRGATATGLSTGVLLLEHLRDIFGEQDRLTTETILQQLIAREDGPWAGWWERQVRNNELKGPAARLRNLLRPYGVEPKQLWVVDETGRGKKERGYERGDFLDAWSRYLQPPTLPEDGRDGEDGRPQVNGGAADQHSTEFTNSTEFPGVPRGSLACDRCDYEPPPAFTDMTGLPHPGCPNGNGRFRRVG